MKWVDRMLAIVDADSLTPALRRHTALAVAFGSLDKAMDNVNWRRKAEQQTRWAKLEMRLTQFKAALAVVKTKSTA